VLRSSYDHRQVEQLKPMFDYTVQFAQLQPLAPPARAMLAAMAHDQRATNGFIGAFIGSVQLSDIFPAEIIEGFSQTVRRLAAARKRVSHVA